ncbi:MAG: uroporphyrinogen decarboxylase family protein [Planctomycetota bacterium]
MVQTSREVVDALLRGRPAERVGLHDSPWRDTLERWTTEGMPTDAEGKPVDPIDHFGFDLAGCGGWFDYHPKRGVDELVEETDEWKITRNGSGAERRWWKNKSGTPEHIRFHMASREIWGREYRPHLLELDPGRVDIEGAKQRLARRRDQGLWTYFGHHFIWEGMRMSMGDETMYMSLAADPDWIHDYNRVYTDFYKGHFKLLLEQAGLPDGAWLYEDLGYKENLFCSPKTLAELIFPYFAELVEFFHGYDLPVVLHTCGYTEPALDLAVEAGFDALNPMEVKAGNRPLRIAEQYADKLAFIGGLDARVLESGDRDLIRREVTGLVEGMKARGARYVFGSDHSISTNVAYDDFRFALDVYRAHMAY